MNMTTTTAENHTDTLLTLYTAMERRNDRMQKIPGRSELTTLEMSSTARSRLLPSVSRAEINFAPHACYRLISSKGTGSRFQPPFHVGRLSRFGRTRAKPNRSAQKSSLPSSSLFSLAAAAGCPCISSFRKDLQWICQGKIRDPLE
jgi:hypothetical protein